MDIDPSEKKNLQTHKHTHIYKTHAYINQHKKTKWKQNIKNKRIITKQTTTITTTTNKTAAARENEMQKDNRLFYSDCDSIKSQLVYQYPGVCICKCLDYKLYCCFYFFLFFFAVADNIVYDWHIKIHSPHPTIHTNTQTYPRTIHVMQCQTHLWLVQILMVLLIQVNYSNRKLWFLFLKDVGNKY